jgi:predicted NBD/HSP70 family sugar kinase
MGCIETYCSATALVYLARDSGMNNISSARDVCRLAEEDDAPALSVLDKYSRFLATALYNYIIILNPEMIVLGGGLSTSARLFLPKAKQYLKTFFNEREDIKPGEIVATSFPDQAGIIGAAYLCMEHKRIAV